MALIFPSASVGQTYSSGSSATYQWNGTVWVAIAPPSVTIPNAVTASVSTAAVSASYSTTSSISVNAISASYSVTSSYILGGATVSSASYASYAETASYALNGGGSNIDTSSLATTGSNTFTGDQYIDAANTLYVDNISENTINGGVNYNAGTPGHNFSGSMYVDGVVKAVEFTLNDAGVIRNDQNQSILATSANSLYLFAGTSGLVFRNQANNNTLATLANNGNFSIPNITGSLLGTASFSTTASFARTASYVTTAFTASYVQTAQTASFITLARSASYVQTAQTASNIAASNVVGTVANAFTASYVATAQTASFVSLAQTASFIATAQTASYVDTARTASYWSGSIISASYAGSASYVDKAISASYVSSSNTIITQNLTVFGTATIQDLHVVTETSSVIYSTGSNKFGDEFTDVHEFTGSVGITGSLIVNGPLIATASYANTASYAANSLPSASWASASLTASYITTAQTASFITGSNVIGTVTSAFTASYVQTAQTASFVSLAQTASWVSGSDVKGTVSSSYTASFALTASYISGTAVYQTVSSSYTASFLSGEQMYVDFNTASAAPTWKSGRLFWDNTNDTLAIYSSESAVTLQVGQENWTRVYNATGQAITNGTVVRLSGTHGDVPQVALAASVQVSGAMNIVNQVLGVATQTIGAGAFGMITTQGIVRGLNTNAYADGDTLYVSTTAGTLTNVAPQAPYEIIPVGQVVKAGPGTSGLIYVAVAQPQDFSDLSSVKVETTYSVGDLFVYTPSASVNVWRHTNQLTGSYGLTGSITSTNGGFTGSLLGTASYAVTSITASYVLGGATVSSASYAAFSVTASYIQTAQTASYVVNALTASLLAGTASQAYTASYVTTAQTASYVATAQTASLLNSTASQAFTASYIATAQTASFVNLARTASFVTASGVVGIVSSAYTASYVQTAQTASYVVTALTASLLNSTASQAFTASYITTAQTASFVTTAQTASYWGGDSNVVHKSGTETIGGWKTFTSFVDMAAANSSYILSVNNSGGGQALSAGAAGGVGGQIYNNSTSSAALIAQNINGAGPIARFLDNSDREVILVKAAGVTITGSLNTSGSVTALSFTGSLQGTATTASYVVTASYALNATQYTMYVATATASWIATHNLGTLAPIVSVYNGANEVIFPDRIKAVSTNVLQVDFTVPLSGSLRILNIL